MEYVQLEGIHIHEDGYAKFIELTLNNMLKYREDLEKVVTKEEIEKRNEIVDKTNERGWFFKKEAKFLLSFEGKARVCNTCGRTLTETKGWRLVSAPDRYGNNLQIGYAANCFECEMRDIMSFDLYKEKGSL